MGSAGSQAGVHRLSMTHRANFIKPLDTWFKVKPGHNLKIDQVSKLGQFH